MKTLNFVQIDANTVAERAGLFGFGRIDVVAHAEDGKFYILEEICEESEPIDYDKPELGDVLIHKAYGPLEGFNMDLHSAQLNWLGKQPIQVKGKTYCIANEDDWTIVEVFDEVYRNNPPVYMEFDNKTEVLHWLADLADDANADNRRIIGEIANRYFV